MKMVSGYYAAIISWLQTHGSSTSHSTTWYCNGDHSRSGYMTDFVLVNSHFLSCALDNRVFRSVYHESDHELVVSSMHFKIKAKCHQTRASQKKIIDLPVMPKLAFKNSLSGTINEQDDPESVWLASNAAMHKAQECRRCQGGRRNGLQMNFATYQRRRKMPGFIFVRLGGNLGVAIV